MIRVATAISVLAVILAWVPAANSRPGDVTPRGLDVRTWLDPQGRTIKRMDAQGRLTFFSRDEAGRIVQASGLKGRFTAKTAEGPIQADVAWTHSFSYDSQGNLIEEMDCREENHSFAGFKAPKVDELRGSAILDHHHLDAPESSTPHSRGQSWRVHYGDRGNIERVESLK